MRHDKPLAAPDEAPLPRPAREPVPYLVRHIAKRVHISLSQTLLIRRQCHGSPHEAGAIQAGGRAAVHRIRPRLAQSRDGLARYPLHDIGFHVCIESQAHSSRGNPHKYVHTARLTGDIARWGVRLGVDSRWREIKYQ
jgi:hypothetical protein